MGVILLLELCCVLDERVHVCEIQGCQAPLGLYLGVIVSAVALHAPQYAGDMPSASWPAKEIPALGDDDDRQACVADNLIS